LALACITALLLTRNSSSQVLFIASILAVSGSSVSSSAKETNSRISKKSSVELIILEICPIASRDSSSVAISATIIMKATPW
tara:strand:- start:92409 stop:92654 length:246 start_codon:yes stop_codon:yes gene_type:complete